MPKLLVIVVMVGLSLGVGLVARAGLSAWVDWVNEPLRQPPDLRLVRPPVTGRLARQTPTRPPTTVPPTLAAATPVRATSTSAARAVASTPQGTATPGAAATVVGTPQRTATPGAAATVGTPRPVSTVGTLRPAATVVSSTAMALSGQQRRVTNTDGQGVALRDAPGGARLPAKGYDEGAVVTILEQQGTWTRIRGQDGREGWVLSVTLAP